MTRTNTGRWIVTNADGTLQYFGPRDPRGAWGTVDPDRSWAETRSAAEMVAWGRDDMRVRFVREDGR